MRIVECISPGITGNLKVTVTIVAKGWYQVIKTDRVVTGIGIGDG